MSRADSLENYKTPSGEPQLFGREITPTSSIQSLMGSRMEAEVLRATRDLIVDMVDWSEIDIIVSVEAMGLPLLAAVGEATGKPTVVIRKRSYGMEGEVRVDVSTGYSSSTAYINDIKPGERVLVVDDVISTGGTLEPSCKH